MKLETFCFLTGWPYEELLQLRLDKLSELLALYDLELKWVKI